MGNEEKGRKKERIISHAPISLWPYNNDSLIQTTKDIICVFIVFGKKLDYHPSHYT